MGAHQADLTLATSPASPLLPLSLQRPARKERMCGSKPTSTQSQGLLVLPPPGPPPQPTRSPSGRPQCNIAARGTNVRQQALTHAGPGPPGSPPAHQVVPHVAARKAEAPQGGGALQPQAQALVRGLGHTLRSAVQQQVISLPGGRAITGRQAQHRVGLCQLACCTYKLLMHTQIVHTAVDACCCLPPSCQGKPGPAHSPPQAPALAGGTCTGRRRAAPGSACASCTVRCGGHRWAQGGRGTGRERRGGQAHRA